MRDREVLRYLEDDEAISIQQATKIFFKNYDSARRRLKQLEEMEILKSYINRITKEKVYYVDKKVSAHDLLRMDFYAELVNNGAKILEFKKQPRLLNDFIRPDAFIKFTKDNNLYFILLEVDLSHFTDSSKLQLYEKLYKENELQPKCYNMFPTLVLLKSQVTTTYKSQNFEVIYLDFTLRNFTEKIF